MQLPAQHQALSLCSQDLARAQCSAVKARTRAVAPGDAVSLGSCSLAPGRKNALIKTEGVGMTLENKM